MALDSNTTSGAGPSSYYGGLSRLAQGHSSPRLDNPYPYFQTAGSFTAPHEHSGSTQLTMRAPVSMNMPPAHSSMASIMNPTMHQSRSNNQPNHNININFNTTLRSNSWDGQGMLPYPWGLPPAFHDRHRASQPDLGQVNGQVNSQVNAQVNAQNNVQVNSSTINFQNQFATNYNNNFNQVNFHQQLYNPSPQISEMSNPNVHMNFSSTRFGYPDGRSYSLVNSSQPFSGYAKPYDKSSPPRALTLFGEPAFSDRPHLCQIPNCGRMFKRLEHLKRHHRSIHTHERPYPCRYPKCSKAFSRSDNLAQHMRIHRQDPHHDL